MILDLQGVKVKTGTKWVKPDIRRRSAIQPNKIRLSRRGENRWNRNRGEGVARK